MFTSSHSSSPLLSKTLKPSSFVLLSFAMKDRPPSSHGSVYVPPHRLRSVINCKNHNSATSDLDSKRRQAPTPVLNSGIIALPSSQTQPPENLQKGNSYSNSLQYNSAFDDGVSEGGSLSDFESAPQLGSSSFNDMSEWRQRLMMLLHDTELEELVSREKKDKLNFERIAALANSMGLYSHIYAKIVVVSKLPLPNYRFDLDDRRPQREVALPYGLLGRVDAYFEEHLTQKSRFKESFPVKAFSRSNSVEEGLFEKPEPLASSKAAMETMLWRRSLQLRDQQHAWQNSSEGKEMLDFRKSLPAYREKDALLTAISQNQVVIVSGETGCGKTTQIPQFILESEIESLRGASCSVICTQPRRISAISVSDRVASERGQKLGESVGYKVRLEGLKGRDTHLLFCTTGILLRRLLVDRNLKGVTHVIVDEIHERGMNEDFLLIVLKDLLPRRPELRLILMSATLDAEIFSSYFVGAQKVHIPGFTFPIQTFFLEDILQMSGYKLTTYNQIDDYGLEKMWKMSKQAPRKRKSQIASAVEDALKAADFKVYSAQTQESLLCWNPDCIGFNLIEHLLANICKNEIPGAILVFMTGWDDISSLKEKLLAHPLLGDSSRVLLLTCHGSMASSEQRLIFDEPPKGTRKIVLATNIAETSITINDVVFVLDCGKAKETSYDALNNTPCLLPSWISKVSAQQRRGRAGRIQPGECYHLYPRCVYEAFADYQLPEILRTPLQSLCLQIKSLNLGSISDFLSRALQSPESLAVQNAIEYLKTIGALDEEENLTVLGRYLTVLPMEPKLGKMLVLGAIFNCLDPILTVVAGLSVRDPFLTPFDKKDLAEAAKYQFSQDNSDHLALVRAFEGWKNAERDFAGYDFCWKNFLSVQSMKAIDSLRKEYFSLLSDTGIVNGHTTNYNECSHDEYLVRSVICYGLYPGVCSVVHNERSFSLKTMEDGQVLLHSNSVNARDSRIPFPWLVFNEKIKVNSVFLRDSTAVSDSSLLLFGGSILKGDNDGHLKMLGGYLEFFMDPAIAHMYQSLRGEIDDLIQKKLLNPKMDLQPYKDLISAVRLLISEDRGDGKFIFGHQILKLSKSSLMKPPPPPPPLVSRTESGPGGDNSKSQLQTLLTRAGYDTPMYKAKQLKNNQFRASVEFNGVEVMGQPCNNKKSAEKDAAAEALQWLMSGSEESNGIDRMSMLLKKSKKCRN